MKSTLVVATVLAVTLTGCSDARKTNSQAEAAKAAQPQPEAELAMAQAEAAKTAQARAEAAQAELAQRQENQEQVKREQEKEKALLEQEQKKKALEEALTNAKVLEAPALGSAKAKGRLSNLDEFSEQIRKMASDEFVFKDAKSQVYRATFDQRNLSYRQVIEHTHGRNTLVFPGKYGFDQKQFECQFHLWYDHQGIAAGLKEYTDSCALISSVSVDEASARRWRDAFEQGSLKLTIWFRLVAVHRAAWEQNPGHQKGILMHDIVFRVEVLRFE